MRKYAAAMAIACSSGIVWAAAAANNPPADGSAGPVAAETNTPPPANPLRLVLPPVVHAVPGREINIYFDNIVLAPNLADYLFDVECGKGRQQSERWTFTPATNDVGDHDLRIVVLNAANLEIASATTCVRVAAADAGAGRPLTCLIIGDSLTANSAYPAELYELCRAPGNPVLTLIGTHTNAALPDIRHEGYGGWTAARFAAFYSEDQTLPSGRPGRSPFVFPGAAGAPEFDFPRYLRELGLERGPDVITICLGINDNFRATDQTIDASIDDMLGHLNRMLAAFRAARADTVIGLFLIPPPAATQDAFGANYQCTQTRWQYRRNQHRILERMLAEYAGREQEGIELIPAYVNLDALNNYPKIAAPANARAAVEVTRLNNGVHPSREGYHQMADSLYSWMKNWCAASTGALKTPAPAAGAP